VAEWLGSSLQNCAYRFESGLRLVETYWTHNFERLQWELREQDTQKTVAFVTLETLVRCNGDHAALQAIHEQYGLPMSVLMLYTKGHGPIITI
jgi:hypothetical protein